jgi:hypothetical protein
MVSWNLKVPNGVFANTFDSDIQAVDTAAVCKNLAAAV